MALMSQAWGASMVCPIGILGRAPRVDCRFPFLAARDPTLGLSGVLPPESPGGLPSVLEVLGRGWVSCSPAQLPVTAGELAACRPPAGDPLLPLSPGSAGGWVPRPGSPCPSRRPHLPGRCLGVLGGIWGVNTWLDPLGGAESASDWAEAVTFACRRVGMP